MSYPKHMQIGLIDSTPYNRLHKKSGGKRKMANENWNLKVEQKKGFNWLKAMRKGTVFGFGSKDIGAEPKRNIEFDSNGKAILKQPLKREKEQKEYSDYENIVNLLKANGNSLKHARTGEIILGTSFLDKKRFKIDRKSHLKGLPRIAYQNYQNAVQNVIIANFQTKTVSVESIEPRKTHTWKSVYTQKHSRRK